MQLQALEAIVEQERRARKAREARHKLELDRLRGHISDLQVHHCPVASCTCQRGSKCGMPGIRLQPRDAGAQDHGGCKQKSRQTVLQAKA